MYESPIQRMMEEAHHKMLQLQEDSLMCAVESTLGFKVDKEQLLQALKYDRGQYDMGYKDAMKKAIIIPEGATRREVFNMLNELSGEISSNQPTFLHHTDEERAAYWNQPYVMGEGEE